MKPKQLLHFTGVWLAMMLILQGVTSILALEGNPGQDEKQWRQSITRHRLQKDTEMKTSPTSPMAAVKRLVVKPAQKTFVIETERNVTLSKQNSPGVQFSLVNKTGQWFWQRHAPGVTCTAANKPLAPGSSLNQRVLFQGDKCLMAAYPSKDSLVLLVFDPLRPEIKHFSHLIYFSPDPAFAVPAALKIFPKITKVTMLTSQNLEKTFYRYAVVRFRLEGKELQLAAFKYALQGDDSDILFIPFGDKTNGKETYGSGRFLEIHEPGDPNFILDFNLCFNPLCNYSPAYNCPLPPLENILDVPIKAGEKTYPH